MIRPEFVFLDLGNVIVSFDRERSIEQMAAESGAAAALIAAFLESSQQQESLERGHCDWRSFHDHVS